VLYGTLKLDVTSNGATFTLPVTLLGADWVDLPGNVRTWPKDVKADGKALAFSERQGRPAAYLPTGTVTLTGGFDWPATPAQLALPRGLGLLELTVDGTRVTLPQVSDNTLWLVADDGRRPQGAAATAQAQPDHMDVRVFRRIEDTLPAKVITRVRLTVAGKEREETLPPVLLAGTKPNSYSGGLPARLEADGSLKLQVRPGVHELTFLSRAEGELTLLTAPAMPWGEEFWVFQPYPDLRLADVSGGLQIDPYQTDLPDDWRQLAAWRLTQGDALTFATQRRGAEKPPANSLHLYRTLWLDFNGKGLTVNDAINGTMWDGWRLNLTGGTLERATVNGQLSPITTNGERAGVEVRTATVNVEAQSRLSTAAMGLIPTALTINGWDTPMTHTAATLNVPVGWDILAITGADTVNGTLVSQWNLFDLFYVLILSLMVAKLWRPSWGALTLGVLLLTFQHLAEIKVMLFLTLVLVAAVRLLPEGKLAKWAATGRYALVALIALHSWPLLVAHIQFAVYPQLSTPRIAWSHTMAGGFGGVGALADMGGGGMTFESPPQPRALSAAPQMMSMEKAARARGAMRRDGAEMAVSMDSADGAYDNMVTEGVVSASPRAPAMTEIDPDAKLQTGRALPQWSWTQVSMGWDGPMAAGTTARAWLISPLLNRLINLLSAAAFALLLLRLALDGALRLPPLPTAGGKGRKAAKAALAGLLLLPLTAQANTLPDRALLDDLQRRLLEAPKCVPHCATVHAATLELTGDSMSLTLNVDALSDTMVPLPRLNTPWVSARVSVDGKPAEGAIIADGGHLHTLVRRGSRTITLSGRLPNVTDETLTFRLLPKTVAVKANGWRVSNIDEHGRPRGPVMLSRITAATPKAEDKTAKPTFKPLQFPGFVTVERQIALDMRWKVSTIVTLQSGEPTTIRYPLMDGERLLGGLPVEDGHVVINLGRAGQRVRFDSEIDIQDTLTLTAATGTNWSELWSVSVHPKWRLSHSGLTPVYHVTGGQWQPQWRPYAGESVALTIGRPLGADGQELTVHSARLNVLPGKRATNNDLTVDIETSKPRNHTFTLPQAAKLTSLSLNSQLIQTEADGGKVTVSLPAGRHHVVMHWREEGEVPLGLRAPQVDLGVPTVANSTIQMGISPDRWTLLTRGPQMGPAVLLWGILGAMALLGIVLSRVATTPVKGWEWFLLSLGLSQLDPLSILIPIGWVLALSWRATAKLPTDTPRQAFMFNSVQVGLVGLTVLAVSVLFQSVKHGLLATPVTYVSGNGSSTHALIWYQDFAASMPEVWALTLPILAYRLLMMVWALWTAVLLLRLMRWSWQAFSAGGYWKKPQPVQK
jgi:hypothetical protein